MIVTATRQAQSIFQGITREWKFNPKDSSGAAYSSEPTSAANYFVIPASSYIANYCIAGEKISIMNASLTYAYRPTIVSVTKDTSTGLMTVVFDGDALNFMNWSGCFIGVRFGHATGSTDTIGGLFGNVNGVNNGLNSFKCFGIED